MNNSLIILCIVVFTAQQIQGLCKEPKEICEDSGNTGATTYDCDGTCNKFIICYQNAGGILQGLIKVCPSGQYYDNSLKICSSQKPTYCA